MKKQRFNEIINDLAMNKAFFMSFARHPSLLTAEGILRLLQELTDAKNSKEYRRMLEPSKKSLEVSELKRKRDQARVNVKRGEREWANWKRTKLAAMCESGELDNEQERAEKPYGDRTVQGLAHYLGPRMGE